MIIVDDADHPAVERGRYVIGYIELVDGYRHAYADPDSRRGRRHGKVRYSRTADHPTDPRCPECHPVSEPEQYEEWQADAIQQRIDDEQRTRDS